MITTEGHEVGLSRRVKWFQSPRHKLGLRLRNAPLKPKNGLNGPPAGPTGFFGVSSTSLRPRRRPRSMFDNVRTTCVGSRTAWSLLSHA
jgi:hypothetical protein